MLLLLRRSRVLRFFFCALVFVVTRSYFAVAPSKYLDPVQCQYRLYPFLKPPETYQMKHRSLFFLFSTRYSFFLSFLVRTWFSDYPKRVAAPRAGAVELTTFSRRWLTHTVYEKKVHRTLVGWLRFIRLGLGYTCDIYFKGYVNHFFSKKR